MSRAWSAGQHKGVSGHEGGHEVAVDRLVGAGKATSRRGEPIGSSSRFWSVARSRPVLAEVRQARSTAPGEMPEMASETGVPSASRIAAAVTRSIPGSR